MSLVLTIVVATIFSVWLTLRGITEAYYFESRLFLYQQAEFDGYETQGYFKWASHHPFLNPMVHSSMQAMGKTAIEKNNQYDMRQYVLWAGQTWINERLSHQTINSSVLLAQVFNALGESEKATEVTQKNALFSY